MSNYEEVASNIISKSINSVMYIDDALLEPFKPENEGSKELSEGIFNSFKQENCNIDFYKFKDSDNWEERSLGSLRGKDMLILDWQLSTKSPEYAPTLKILADAVKKPNLHFVCIYTDKEAASFPDLFYNINSYFAPFPDALIDEDLKNIQDLIDAEGADFDTVFSQKVIGFTIELMLYPENSKEIMESIRKEIISIDNIGEKLYDVIKMYFVQKIKEHRNVYPSLAYCFCGLGIAVQKVTISHDDEIHTKDIRNYVSQNFMILNHTIVLLTNKNEVEPKNLYEKFKKALIHDSGNFLTLMGLEMRNLFKESSSFIGKDIDSINELAFFHHKEKSHPQESFYDFLRELWKSQAASFLYDKNNRPQIFDALDDYKNQSGIEEKMKAWIENPKENVQSLGKLNYYYNTLVTSRPDNDIVKFGDVFEVKNSGKFTNQYLLCITAHCDCLYAEDKINSLFYFVKGSKGKLEDALEKGDTGFDSYVMKNNSIEVINWGNKPFTLYIKPENNNIDTDIPVLLGADARELKHFTTLKENYAQRVANSAFIYPLHVGIFFADTKK